MFRTPDDRVFAIEDRCPHRHGPLSQGIVHGGSRDLPAAQLGDLASKPARPQGADEGSDADHSRPSSSGDAIYLALSHDGLAGGLSHGDPGQAARRSGRPAPIAASAAACIATASTGRAVRPSRGDPDHPANFGRLCSKGSALARNARPRRPACSTRRSTAGASRWDAALDLRRRCLRPHDRRARPGLASPSTFRARC